MCFLPAAASSVYAAGQPAEKLLDEKLTAEMKEVLEEPEQEQMPLLLRLTRNASSEVRQQAMTAIQDLDLTGEATQAIIARAADKEPDVRKRAAELLMYFGVTTPEAIAAAKKLLLDKDADVQSAAVYYADELNEEAKPLIPELLKIIAAGESDICSDAIDALNDAGQPPAAAPILKAAFMHYPETALYAIAQIEPPQKDLLPWLHKIMMKGDSAEQQEAAAWAIGRYGDESHLIQASTNDSITIQMVAMSGLGGLRQPSEKAIKLLIAGMNHKSHHVRRHAAESAGYIHEPDDVLLGSLAKLFADANIGVRRVSRVALDMQFDEERVDAPRMNRALDKAIAATPKERGLHLARAVVVYPVAYDLLIDGENEKSLRLFNQATVGLVHTVLKDGYKLTYFESDEVSTFFYDGACAACRCKQPAIGLKYLTAALENGWDEIDHLKEDTDLDPLRKLPGYKALLKKHGNK